MNSLIGTSQLLAVARWGRKFYASSTGNPVNTESKFASRVFLIAGILGILALAPQYFLAGKVGWGMPGPIDRPEYFYGFIGVALVWQFACLLISRDVMRYRPFMPILVLEKLSFGVPVVLLYMQGRVGTDILAGGCMDLTLGFFFFLAYRATAPESARAVAAA